jgi:hypothetical protein
VPLEKYREWQRKHFGSKYTGLPYGKKQKRVAKAKTFPLPHIPKTNPVPKVVNTTGGSVRSNYKALKLDNKLVIKDNERPYVEIRIDSKTQIRVPPHRVEGAVERYYRCMHKSKVQSHIHQRKPVAKTKQKEHKSDLIFFH